jgi:hypothetical protein
MPQKDYVKLSASEQKKEDWMNTKWRPAMGWMYMVVCMADFVVFPILWSIVQVHGGGQVNSQWQPITLQGAGLFHIAMGAILGIAAYGRTQEKMAGANNGGLSVPGNVGTPYNAPTPVMAAPRASTGFSAPTPSYSAPAPSFGDVGTGWGGKKAPPEPEFYPER